MCTGALPGTCRRSCSSTGIWAHERPCPCRAGRHWSLTGLVYEFLQVLLISYFAKNGDGIFLHSCGIGERSGEGLVFAGKESAGKSTTARLWYRKQRRARPQ